MKHLLVAMIVLPLVGCGSILSVKQTAQLATVSTLTGMDADREKATKVLKIAVEVQDAINQDGSLDGDAIKADVIRAIRKNFDDPQERAVLMLLADHIAIAIMDELEKNPLGVNEAGILMYVRAATDGVISGAGLYISSFEE